MKQQGSGRFSLSRLLAFCMGSCTEVAQTTAEHEFFPAKIHSQEWRALAGAGSGCHYYYYYHYLRLYYYGELQTTAGWKHSTSVPSYPCPANSPSFVRRRRTDGCSHPSLPPTDSPPTRPPAATPTPAPTPTSLAIPFFARLVIND